LHAGNATADMQKCLPGAEPSPGKPDAMETGRDHRADYRQADLAAMQVAGQQQ
jgi:hypothetical protein